MNETENAVVTVPDFPEPLDFVPGCEVMIPENVSEEIREFAEFHNSIIRESRASEAHLREFIVHGYHTGKKLEQAAENKKYKKFGFSTFDDYCQRAIGISHTQAYAYKKIAKTLPEDFVRSAYKIGFAPTVKALLSIANLEEPVRQEFVTFITENENVSKEEAKSELEVMKAQHKADIEVINKQHKAEIDRQKAGYEANLKDQREMLEQARSAAENYKERMKTAKEKAENLTGHIAELEQQIKELESAPKEVNVAIPVEVTEQLRELEQAKADLETELQEARKREQEAKSEADRILDESAEATDKLEKLEIEVEELRNKPIPKAVPDAKELFRPYYRAFTHSLGVAMEFLSGQTESPDFDFMLKKMKETRDLFDDQLKNLKG